MTNPTWTEVVKALEVAKEGSRELDAMIAEALGWRSWEEDGAIGWRDHLGRSQVFPYIGTRSLDAGRALIREKLPEHGVLSAFMGGSGTATIWTNHGKYQAKAPTEPLAQALTFARAMEKNDEN